MSESSDPFISFVPDPHPPQVLLLLGVRINELMATEAESEQVVGF
jgi:hypothetical protein